MALRGKELEFNLQERSRNGHHFTPENPSSRRFSASSREDRKSSRATFTISSTLSSPGYSHTEEIDPSNYSFTRALKALQAKTVYKKNQDWLRPEGIELNSKWNEAEKYICNPLSGEIPMECLSSKTLNSRSFRDVSNVSSPRMILPFNHYLNSPRTTNPNVRIIEEDHVSTDPVLMQEKKVVGLKRDVGVKSAPVNVSLVKTPPPMIADDSQVEFALELKAQHEDVKLEEDKKHMMTEKNQEEKEEREEKKKRGSRLFTWTRKKQRQPTKSKCFFLICLIKAL